MYHLSSIIIIYHHGCHTKYSTAHISGSTGPKMFKLWQNREAMSTRGWLSLVTIARWEPLISSMWKKIHLDIIVSWQPYLSFNALRLILLRIFFFFGLPCGLARPLIYVFFFGYDIKSYLFLLPEYIFIHCYKTNYCSHRTQYFVVTGAIII